MPQVARLQIRFVGAGFGRYQLARGDVDHDRIDIRQLATVLVDPVVKRIALEDESDPTADRWC